MFGKEVKRKKKGKGKPRESLSSEEKRYEGKKEKHLLADAP